jgi:hypothetical protein
LVGMLDDSLAGVTYNTGVPMKPHIVQNGIYSHQVI